jgi:hypothetical protein
VHEIKNPGERIAAIARDYARSSENTLVVSPDNRSRVEINQAIHTELQSRGLVGKEEYRVDALVPRQGLTGAHWTGPRGTSSMTSCSTRAIERDRNREGRLCSREAHRRCLEPTHCRAGRWLGAHVRSTPAAGSLSPPWPAKVFFSRQPASVHHAREVGRLEGCEP